MRAAVTTAGTECPVTTNTHVHHGMIGQKKFSFQLSVFGFDFKHLSLMYILIIKFVFDYKMTNCFSLHFY